MTRGVKECERVLESVMEGRSTEKRGKKEKQRRLTENCSGIWGEYGH